MDICCVLIEGVGCALDSDILDEHSQPVDILEQLELDGAVWRGILLSAEIHR